MIYSEIVDWYRTHINEDGSTASAIVSIDKEVSDVGFWAFAVEFGALSENGSCESFSIAHMAAYNDIIGKKY